MVGLLEWFSSTEAVSDWMWAVVRVCDAEEVWERVSAPSRGVVDDNDADGPPASEICGELGWAN